METIPALVIALLTAIFISLPFFIRRGGGAADEEYFPDSRTVKLKEINSRKDSLLTAIKDIEFDYGLGKLTRDDFEELHGKYRVEAARLLKEIDTMAGASPTDVLDDDLEKEIRAERSKFLMPYDDEEIEKEILRAREASWDVAADRYCTKCGSASGEEDLFCSRCGAKLNPMTENRNARQL